MGKGTQRPPVCRGCPSPRVLREALSLGWRKWRVPTPALQRSRWRDLLALTLSFLETIRDQNKEGFHGWMYTCSSRGWASPSQEAHRGDSCRKLPSLSVWPILLLPSLPPLHSLSPPLGSLRWLPQNQGSRPYLHWPVDNSCSGGWVGESGEGDG